MSDDVVICTHGGPEHTWDPGGSCPDALEAGTWAVRPSPPIPAPADDSRAEAREQIARALSGLSRWVDAGNAHRDREALLWHRVGKVSEECGEVVAALIGATGGNPRKGVTGSMTDVIEELLDVAVTALGAVEHINNNDGQSLDLLADKILRVHRRAFGGLP